MGLFDLLSGEEPLSKNKIEKEISSIEKKIDEAKKHGEHFRAAWLCQLAGKLARQAKDSKKAIDYFLSGVEWASKSGNTFNVGWLYRLAANTAFEAKDYKQTLKLAVSAADYFLRVNSKYAAQWSYNLAARAAEATKELYAAIRFYKKSAELIEDKEIRKKIEKLRDVIPHPLVEEIADRKEAGEGEEIRFEIIVENNSSEVMKNVCLVDKDAKVVEKINWLHPKEEKAFSYKTIGKVGAVRPLYETVNWENTIGDSFKRKIEPVEVRIVPSVEVITTINPGLRLNKASDFVILVRNLSSSKITDVGFDVDFPKHLDVKNLTPTSFERILPGEEKGVVFELVPKIVGETLLKDIRIMYTDEFGRAYLERVEPVVLKEVLKELETPALTKEEIARQLGQTGLKHLENIEKSRQLLQLTENPISESEYLKLAEKFDSLERGYTLANIDMETVGMHILKECRFITLIASRQLKDEQLFLFSGKAMDAVYLLTVAVKQLDKHVNLLFKAYSSKKEGLEDFLNRIADIIRYTIIIMSSAKEVEKVEVTEVINIIDSIVQRSKIGVDVAKNKETEIKESVVQRSGV